MTRTLSRNSTAIPIFRRLLLLTGAITLLPVALYPRTLGFPALDLNPAVSLLEWAFYATFLGITTASLPLSTRIVAGGFTVLFRLALGALSGVLVGWMHQAPVAQTVVETMWSYPMALIPQVLISALATGPLWEHLMVATNVRRTPRRNARTDATRTTRSAVAVSSALASRAASTSQFVTLEPSFDDAVSYVGEYSGVRLCWIVDRDGLPVAVWQRQRYTGDADFWAPVSIQLIDMHRDRLSFGGDTCNPERLEVRTNQGRLVIEAVRDLWLGVLTDPDADELISVRITRARDMIAKNLHAEGGDLVAAGEAQYV